MSFKDKRSQDEKADEDEEQYFKGHDKKMELTPCKLLLAAEDWTLWRAITTNAHIVGRVLCETQHRN